MKMKKSLVTVMTLAMIMGITACGANNAQEQQTLNVEPAEGQAIEAVTETQEVAETQETSENQDATENADNGAGDADAHFLEYLKGNETDAKGENFWAVDEPDIEYSLYDMNGDGTNELIVRAYGSWIFDILEYKEGKIQNAGVENLGSSGVTFINDKNQFVSGDTGHQGRAMYVVSEIDGQGNTNLVLALVNYVDDWAASGSPEFYKKENPSSDYLEKVEEFDTITEDEFNSLVDEISKENTAIQWTKLN